MDLDTLQATVRGGLSNGAYGLAASSLGGEASPVGDLFGTVFAAPALALSSASVATSETGSTVTGTLISAPIAAWTFLAGMGVTAEFSLDDTGTPQARLTLVPSAAQTWTLLDTMTGWRDTLLGGFTWSGSKVVFDSAAPATLPATFPTMYDLPANPGGTTPTTGMELTQTLSHGGGEGTALAWLLGQDGIVVSGPVAWAGADAVAMDLASAPLTPLSVDGFSISLDFHALAFLTAVSGNGSAPSAVATAFSGSFTRTSGTRTVTFTVVAGQDPGHLVTLFGKHVATLGLSDVAGLLGVEGDGLQNQQPPSCDFGALVLDTVVLTVDTRRLSLVSAQASVTYTPPAGNWPSGNDGSILTFAGLAITFSVVGPLSAPFLQTEAATTATLADGKLDAKIAFPQLDFSCELAEGSTLDVTELFKAEVFDAEVMGGKPFGSLLLVCSALVVEGNTETGVYAFQATLADSATSPWTLDVTPDGSVAITLSSVAFNIVHTRPPGGAPATGGTVAAQFSIANTPLQLTATLPTATAGWSLAGGTMDEQSIALSDLVEDINSQFKASLPTNLSGMTITSIEASIQAGATSDDPMSFGFSCDTSIGICGVVVDVDLEVGRTYDAPGADATVTFVGYIYVGEATFEVDFSAGGSGTNLSFVWSDTETPLDFGTVAQFFGFTMPDLPEQLDLTLTGARFSYDTAESTVAFSAQSTHGEIAFASFVGGSASAQPGQRFFVFDIDVALNASLSRLPVVGPGLPDDAGVQQLQLVWSNFDLGTADLAQAARLITADLGGPALLATTVSAGVTLAASLTAGGSTVLMVLPLASGAPADAPAGATTPPQVAAPAGASAVGSPTRYEGQAKWFEVGKSLGPVTLGRIGIEYSGSTLYLLFDAQLSLSTLSLGLDGLGFGSPLTAFSPVPHLDGISVAFSSGPVTISGSLLHLPTDADPDLTDDWAGEVTIGVAPYAVAGAAGYARVGGTPSFFAFAQVQGGFGGSPAFFVTGFMGGFGYNSQLALPTVDEVHAFPFVAGLIDASALSSPAPMDVLALLSGNGSSPAWVTPAQGPQWAAAGIAFTSFDLVIGHLLLVATFGRDFELALLGLATMSLPQGDADEAYAYVDFQIDAVFRPSQGALSVAASLTPDSYLFTRDCHLTGGFAFCLWFGDPSTDPHSGDFVVTIGGYHPAFTPPAWYPQVAAVGFNWPVDGQLTIKGGAYFALTPSAVMAGGTLEASFTSSDLSAWFTAYANLLVRWKPFSFQAQIGISVGASYRLDLWFTTVTLSVELGATLNLLGPPLAGTITVHWSVISFTVAFGASQGGVATTVDWDGFRLLLPTRQGGAPPPVQGLGAVATGTATVLSLNANAGLARVDSAGTWIVRSDRFAFTASSAIPASTVSAGGTAVATAARLNIRPMGVSGATSSLTVTLAAQAGAGGTGTDVPLAGWTLAAATGNLPEAMWGAPLTGAQSPAPAAALISGLLTGLTATAPPVTGGTTVGPFGLLDLVDTLAQGSVALDPGGQADPLATPGAQTSAIATIASTLAQSTAADNCTSLLAALAAMGAAPPAAMPLTRLAAGAGTLFSQAPMILS